MTRRRINVAFLERGFVDPILASTCTQVAVIKDQYDLTLERLFEVFCRDKCGASPSIDKEEFVESLQAMEIKTSVEDINELFNYIDVAGLNRITKQQFVNSISFITSKIGGGGIESCMSKGILQAKKNVTNSQLVFRILRSLADGIQQQKLTIG